jgi:hypothetical protein
MGRMKHAQIAEHEREHFEDVKAFLIDHLTNGHTEPLDHEITEAEVWAAEGEYEASMD